MTTVTAPDPQAHCAKFSDALLPQARHLLSCVAGLPAGAHVLDPFAGIGKGVDYLVDVCGFDAWGIELEPEWAKASKRVVRGNALHIGEAYSKARRGRALDAVFTSPTYGNRMADKDMRESVAGTYAKSLGRHASEGSSCHMQWGNAYRDFHTNAWIESAKYLAPRAWFLLNIKDHFRGKELAGVPDWHCNALEALGFEFVDEVAVATPGNRHGANSELRVDHELLMLFRAP